MEALLIQYWYPMLFPLSFVEWWLSTLAGWFLISTWYFNFWIAFPIILFSSALCDTILYRIGRKAIHSKKVIAFIDRSNFLSDNFKTMERLWANHPIKTMLLGKNAFMIGVAVVISAGMAKMNYLRFLLYDIPACFLQLIVLLSIGYYLGNWYLLAAQYIQYPSILLAIVLVIMRSIYRQLSKKITKKFEKREEDSNHNHI